LSSRTHRILRREGDHWSFTIRQEGYSANLRNEALALSAQDASEIETILRELQIPDVPKEEQFGLDGTDYVLEMCNGTTQTFSWWCELPPQWKGLRPLVDFLLRL
jgi:hypothetical protein